jgi:hypothetical protein
MTPDSQGFCPSGKHDAIKTQFSSTVKIISGMRTATRKLLSTACDHLTVCRLHVEVPGRWTLTRPSSLTLT